jgi:hypothetical protein
VTARQHSKRQSVSMRDYFIIRARSQHLEQTFYFNILKPCSKILG